MRRTFLLAIALASGHTIAAGGSDADALKSELEQLRALVMKLEQRLADVERQQVVVEELTALTKINPVAAKSVQESSVTLASDFRLRYESIERQGSERRERERLRARASLTYKGNDFTGVLGVASSGNSPTSTNQTLGGGGNSQGLQLDMAYVIYPLNDQVKLLAGKMKNPLHRPGKKGLVWDSDYRPEGVFLTTEAGDFEMTAGSFWLESDTKNSNERAIYALQGLYNTQLGETKMKVGLGYFEANLSGDEAFWSGDTIKLGNYQDCSNGSCVFTNDYHVIEAFVEANFTSSISGFAHWIENTQASSDNMGYVLGLNIGKAENAGDWAFEAAWQRLENEATIAMLTDSDFAGGGTGGEGSELMLSYKVSPSLAINLLYSDTERATYTDPNPLDYKRLVLDFSMKY